MNKENNIGETSGVEIFSCKSIPTELTTGSVSTPNEDDGKASMDSFITVRPPRGRRYSQPAAVYNPATVQKHNHPCMNASNHRHRSSSQPRPYQSIDSLPPTQMETSVRSASQPRSSQNSHFLDSFNVADCYDVRTIPDPPTPSPGNARRRHRRRVSSSVLRPMSSMDVNNRGNNKATLSNHGRDSKSSFVTRRKRKTMSHVPSPINPAEEEGAKLESDVTISVDQRGSEERCDVEMRSDHLQMSFGREDEEEMTKDSPKRKKKRQSIVIPRHLPLEENDSLPDDALVNLAKKSPSKAKKEFVPLDFNSMQKLRSLVRGYCSHPSNEERQSNDAKEILTMTGYPLPKKAANIDDASKSAAVLSNRRIVIQKIAPVLAQLESRKKRDIKMWENKTHCRVTKSERSGRYKYYDVESNKKVGSQEYKRRYIAVLEEERPNRLSRAQQWMNELNHNPDIYYTSDEPEEYGHPNPNDMYRHEQDDIDIIEMQQKEAFLPPRNINIVRDGTSRGREAETNEFHQERDHQKSEYLSNTPEMSDVAEITEASSEDTEDKSTGPSDSIKSETSNVFAPMIGNHVSPRAEEKVSVNDVDAGDDVKDSVPLLPLPSKDSESMDPEIKAAEKRLWAKIDRALHEYSGEVMMIQRKKRRLAEANPVL